MIDLQRQQGSVTVPEQRYESVARDLIDKIRAGVYPPGHQLPSRAQLRGLYDVSDTVLDRAMMILRMGRWTETLPGVGVFVVEDLPD